ncbi:FKBP-type peptidyl-prolyl cis-trans isomerase [Salibacteraceae bacterium]|jgi:FKBP-type peptidyl-prolyl cis-trans isomerase FkpA|nr:FKBP-type peptidyl-prolyl cis-trans isomerase [Salibacteraceae bacterium]MDB4105644.1 FKBP-type peptidyl-prolyl cis-trans isomerase [Salibacteraceae bacterium]MDC1304930.1 FKBP-type peptidyl-prolyl cis-trans isomerase [Salibacteraceae bacterium]
MKLVQSIALIGILLISFSCKKDNDDQAAIDDKIIKDYIAENSLDAEPTGTGLYVVINEEGSGFNPSQNSNVSVYYKGYFTDGEVFDETGREPISFKLSQVIQGWQEGIPYFKPGGSGILLIPSALGYGSDDVGAIPANSVLIFDIDLVTVN